MASWTPNDLLPGLLTLVVALGLAGLLHRGWDALPWRTVALAAVALVLLFFPVLFTGATFQPTGKLVNHTPFRQLAPTDVRANPVQGDPLLQMGPWQRVVHRAWAAGAWPLWNRHAGAGEPLLGNPQATVLEPLHVMTRGLAPGPATGARAALTVWTAWLFGLLLLRRWGFAPSIAAIGASAHALGAFVQLWLAWPLAIAAAALPAAGYAVLTAIDRRRHRDLALVMTTTAWLALCGHPEGALLAGGLVVALGIARWRQPTPDDRPPRRSLAGIAGAIGLGLALAAPGLLPASHALPDTLRYQQAKTVRTASEVTEPRAGAAHDRPTGERGGGVGRWVPMLAPHAGGNDRYGAYWGPNLINDDAAGFAGTAIWVAVLLGLFARRTQRPGEWGARWLLLAALVVAARPGPLLALFEHLPILGLTAGLSRISLWIGPLCIFLAACTWQRWRTAPPGHTAIVSTATLMVLFLSWAYAQATPADVEPRVLSLRLATFVLQLAVVLAASLLMSQRGRGRLAPAALALVVVVELWLLHTPANPTAPRRLDYPTVPALAWLADHVGDARMTAVGTALPANLAAAYDLDDARTFHAARPMASRRLLRPALAPGRRTVDRIAHPDHPILQLLGVRYVLADRGAWLPAPLTLVHRRPSGWIYERPALPRLFLPTAATVDDDARWPQRVARIDDFAAFAVVLDAPFPPDTRWRARAPAASSLDVVHLGADVIRAEAELREPRLMATSVLQDGGWRLLVDGRRQPTFRANGPLVAAYLPNDARRLTMLYRPPGFLLGLLLSALAFTAALVWWLPLPPIGGTARPGPPRAGVGA